MWLLIQDWFMLTGTTAVLLRRGVWIFVLPRRSPNRWQLKRLISVAG